jgi:hypothetical protein
MAIVDFDTCAWTDPDMIKLPFIVRSFFYYLWTNDHKNLAAIYPLSLQIIKNETGITEKTIKEYFPLLKGKVEYDYEKEIVWVINHVKRQFMRTNKISPKIITGIEKCLLSLGSHYFIKEFLEKYSMLNINYPYPIMDRVSRYPPSGGEGGGKGSFSPDIKEEKNGLFEKFYQVYPNKKSKGKALKAWAKIKPAPDEQLVATMIATIERAKTSKAWLKDNGEFIPHPATWLNDQGWLDEIVKPIKPSPTQIDGGRAIQKEYDCPGCKKTFSEYTDYLKHKCLPTQQLAERG